MKRPYDRFEIDEVWGANFEWLKEYLTKDVAAVVAAILVVAERIDYQTDAQLFEDEDNGPSHC